MSSILEESKKSKSLGRFKITKKKVIILLILIFAFGFLYSFYKKSIKREVSKIEKEWIVKNGDLKMVIEAEGKVIAEDGVDLSFPVSGSTLEVVEVFAKEGSILKKGDKVARIKTDTLELNVKTARADYQSVLASYNKTMAGASVEDIADAQDQIVSAEISLGQAKITLAETKQQAEDRVRDAEKVFKNAKEKLDKNKDALSSEEVSDVYETLLENVKSINISLDKILKESDEIVGVDEKHKNDNFENSLGAKDVSSLTRAKGSYKNSKKELEMLNEFVIPLNFDSKHSEIDKSALQAQKTLGEFEKHLYDMLLVLEASVISSNFSQSALGAFLSTINGNRTVVNTSILSLNTNIEAVVDAKDNLDDYVDEYEEVILDLNDTKKKTVWDIENAENGIRSANLNLDEVKRKLGELKAQPKVEDIARVKASITSASVNLEKMENELESATILSPIDGELASLNYKVGDIIVDPGNAKSVATIINNDTLFVEVNVGEVDINKISLGQKTNVVFDAIDELKLNGEVSFISLKSSTNQNGIVTYLVRVLIEKGDAPVREGMTASLEFIKDEVKNVLIVPIESLIEIDDKTSMKKTNGESVNVETGRSDNSYIEIISGLKEGDEIVY